MYFIEQLKYYILRSYKHLFIKLLVSLCLTVLSLYIFFKFQDKTEALFIILYMVNYIIVKIIYDIFLNNTKSLYNILTNELYNIQNSIENNNDISLDIKKIILIKFKIFKDMFIKGVLSLQFLQTNVFYPDYEYEKFLEYIDQITCEYRNRWRKSDLDNNLLSKITMINDGALTLFVNKIKHQIYSCNSLSERRRIFSKELGKMIKSTTDQIIISVKNSNI